MTPPRPTGTSPQAAFMQWAWDKLTSGTKVNAVSGQAVNRTTKGTYSIPNATKVTSAASDQDIRIFNFQAYGFGVTIATIAEVNGTTPTKDIGADIPGWSSSIEDSIVSYLSQGKRIKLTIGLSLAMERGAFDSNSCEFFIRPFTGPSGYYIDGYANLTIPSPASAIMSYSFQAEISRVEISGSLQYSECSRVDSSALNNALPLTVALNSSYITSYVPPSPIANNEDGKIIFEIILGITNCSYSCALRNLTIDALPALT